MSISLVWRSDVHLADLAPQSRVDNWSETLLRKLIQVGEIAHQCRASAILDGGDLFHIKSPSRTSHELVQRVAEIHRDYQIPVLGNVGNHDVKFGDLRFLKEAPLGVLFQAGVLLPCFDDQEMFLGPSSLTDPGVKLYPFSRTEGWLKGDPFAMGSQEPVVRIVGVPYHGTRYDMNRFTTITKGSEDHLIVMAHCLASAKGGSMFEGEDIISYGDLAHLDPDVWCFGHWHKDQGITEIAPDKWVVNVGSLSRGSISQDDVARIPSCARMTFTKSTRTIEKVPLQVLSADEVFDLAGVTRKEAKQMTVDALVENLKVALTNREEGSLLEEVRQLPDVPKPVVERVLSYLERSGAR